jgi:hypothetical protein
VRGAAVASRRAAGQCPKEQTARPAEPSSLSSGVPNWGPGETIHFGHKTMRVVAVRGDDADSPPVLVVEEV